MLYDFDQKTPGVKLGESIHLKVYETGLAFGTLMQYSGEKDKAGNDIYEDDIVYDSHNKCNALIGFKQGSFGVSSLNPMIPIGQFLCFAVDRIEVIGNRFENPELLK